MPEPRIPPRKDGMYTRCVRCMGELYMPADILYSEGKVPCTAVNGCRQFIPRGHIRKSR